MVPSLLEKNGHGKTFSLLESKHAQTVVNETANAQVALDKIAVKLKHVRSFSPQFPST